MERNGALKERELKFSSCSFLTFLFLFGRVTFSNINNLVLRVCHCWPVVEKRAIALTSYSHFQTRKRWDRSPGSGRWLPTREPKLVRELPHLRELSLATLPSRIAFCDFMADYKAEIFEIPQLLTCWSNVPSCPYNRAIRFRRYWQCGSKTPPSQTLLRLCLDFSNFIFVATV